MFLHITFKKKKRRAPKKVLYRFRKVQFFLPQPNGSQGGVASKIKKKPKIKTPKKRQFSKFVKKNAHKKRPKKRFFFEDVNFKKETIQKMSKKNGRTKKRPKKRQEKNANF